MKRVITTALLLMMLTSIAMAGDAAPEKRIGFIVDGPWSLNDRILDVFRQEISSLLEGEFTVVYPPDAFVSGDFTLDGITQAVNGLLSSGRADVVVGAGPICSHVLGQIEDLPVPVIAVYVIDPILQEIPLVDSVSGRKNLCYLAAPWHVQNEIAQFREVVDFSTLTVLPSEPMYHAIPQMREKIAAQFTDSGFEVRVAPVGGSANAALEALSDDVDAVYLGALMHFSDDEFARLAQGLIDRKLPSYSLLGRIDVNRGILAGGLPENFMQRMARRTALNIQRILLGEDAGAIPVAITSDSRLAINMATARAINAYPPWQVLTEATLINTERTEISRTLTIGAAVREALAVNLSLAAKKREIAAGRQDVSIARSSLLPQLTVSGSGQMIDDDRAAASMGSQPERLLTGSATVNQVLFSEGAWANLSVQGRLQKAREYDLHAVRMDVAVDAASTYLNVLRAKTFEQIEKDNLRVTRSNLELASVRRAIGTAGPAEVLRWEAEIASNRKSVIEANANRNVAEIALNVLLHRPLEEQFATEEPSIDNIDLLSRDGRLFEYMSDPWSFRRFREFMEQEALMQSPELAQIDEAIAARERMLSSSKRAYWLPTLSLQGDVTNVFSRGGEGAGGSSMSLPGITSADDLNWTVGVQASLPLFQGGRLRAETRQADETLNQLQLERQATADLIGQRMVSALHLAGASYAGIGLSEDAARAADSSLTLAVDAYSRGVLSILDVIDAQNVSLVADRAAANAVFDFLLDLIEVDRASGAFQMLRDDKETEAFFTRLVRFFEEGVQ